MSNIFTCGNSFFKASITGRPCSNSPNDAQCTHTSGALPVMLADNRPKSFLRPETNAFAFGLKGLASFNRNPNKPIKTLYRTSIVRKNTKLNLSDVIICTSFPKERLPNLIFWDELALN